MPAIPISQGVVIPSPPTGTQGDRTTFERTSSFTSGAFPLSDAAAWALVSAHAENRATWNVTPSGTPVFPQGGTPAGSWSQLQNPSGKGPNAYFPTDAQLATFRSGVANTSVADSLILHNPYWDRVTGRPQGAPTSTNFIPSLTPPTTWQILQWASLKWGIPSILFYAEAVQESAWKQPACGDKVTAIAAAYNACPQYAQTTVSPTFYRSLGIMQWSVSTGTAGSGGWGIPNSGTDPMRYMSTAFAADFFGATWRSAYDNPNAVGTSTGWAAKVCNNSAQYITGESQGNAGGSLNSCTTAQLLPSGGMWFVGGFGGYQSANATSYNNAMKGRASSSLHPGFGTGASDQWLAY